MPARTLASYSVIKAGVADSHIYERSHIAMLFQSLRDRRVLSGGRTPTSAWPISLPMI